MFCEWESANAIQQEPVQIRAVIASNEVKQEGHRLSASRNRSRHGWKKACIAMAESVVIESIMYAAPDRADLQAQIQGLVAALSSSDDWERQRARRLLVQIGKPAVEQLTQALTDPRDQVRWEAARALSKMPALDASEALVQALGDGNGGVRWIAADALTALGRRGLPPLLMALMHHSESRNLRDGAHHVLHALSAGELQEILAPVLDALNGPAPIFQVPHKAHAALHALRGEADHRRPPAGHTQNAA